MAFYVNITCALFLTILCLNQYLAISKVEDVAKFREVLGSEIDLMQENRNTHNPGDYFAEDFQDLYFMDATEGTTPAVCSAGMTCGFQPYEQDITEYHYFPFVPYCHCPKDYECVETGQNMRSRFFYYTCQYVTPSHSDVKITEAAIFSNSSNNTSHNLSVARTDSGTTNETETESPEMKSRVGILYDTKEL